MGRVSVPVCTRDGLVVVLGVSVDTTILPTFLSAPACTVCRLLQGTRA